MGNETGTWIMYGVEWDDRSRDADYGNLMVDGK